MVGHGLVAIICYARAKASIVLLDKVGNVVTCVLVTGADDVQMGNTRAQG
jgi:hypothetical protein